MRTLSIAEVGDVAGGFALDEVVSTASKYGFWDWGSSWGLSRPSHFYMDTFGADSYSGGGGGGASGVSEEGSGFDAEWASMMGPSAADSDRAQFFAKWFESASKNELATLKGLVDTLKNTLVQANKVGFSMTIANLNAMSNNLRDAISGAAPAANCGWSFGIDVSNLHREAPHDLARLAGWKAITNLWPASRAGNI
jgi:hypothetical protein